MGLSLSVLSIAASISIFNSLGLAISIPSLQVERGSGRIQTDQIDRGSGRIQAQHELFILSDRGSGRGPAAYRGSGRITNEQAYRGSGRLIG